MADYAVNADWEAFLDSLADAREEAALREAYRCPECSSADVESLHMHPRTGIVTLECQRCYYEWRE